MTEVIKFKDIRKGDTIRTTFKSKGVSLVREGVAHDFMHGNPSTGIWQTKDYGTLSYGEPSAHWKEYTIELLDRPRKPLPTMAGSVILATKVTNFHFGGRTILVLGHDDMWHSLIPEYIFKPERVLEWEHAKIVPENEESK